MECTLRTEGPKMPKRGLKQPFWGLSVASFILREGDVATDEVEIGATNWGWGGQKGTRRGLRRSANFDVVQIFGDFGVNGAQ